MVCPEHIDPPELPVPVEVVSAEGKTVIPGYVDQHVHVIGGGGEAGPYGRTPHLFEQAKELARRGGYIDITSGIREEDGFTNCIKPSEAIRICMEEGVPIEKVIQICGANPARANGLYPKKGCIRPGSDADILFLDEEFLVDTVFARGRKMVEHGKALVKGTFETN